MLKKIGKALRRQKLIPGIGEFKETLSQVLFWGSIANFLMISGTFYYTTLRHIASWFSLTMFVAIAIAGIIIIFVVEYKYVVPSIWAFRGRQMDMRNHPRPRGKDKQVVVAVAGGFDPLNGRGHQTHIQEARKLGDKLVVILSRDDQLVAKGNKPNGTFYPDILDRIAILQEMQSVDEVIINTDPGVECAETLKLIAPDIFAKGGDRTPNNMPKGELEACRAIGCQIVYNIGNPKATSSSELVRRATGAE